MHISPFIENICVYGDSEHNFIIALIIPNRNALKELVQNLEINETDLKVLCDDPTIIDHVQKEIAAHGRASGLMSAEIPRKIKLCCEQWTPDSGLVTAALKIRRKQLKDFYKKDIDAMYGK